MSAGDTGLMPFEQPAIGVALPVCASAIAAGTRSEPATTMESVDPGRWIDFFCWVLVGYAVLGKGCAYLGVPPLFIGEILLATGVFCFLREAGWRQLLDLPTVWLLGLFALWGLLRTEVSEYGINSLRDGVIWGYTAFALIVGGLILAKPARLTTLLRRYGWFARYFPLVVPVIWIVVRFLGESLPRLPLSDVAVIDVKGGDIMVHLAGALAFAVAFGQGIGGIRLLMVALAVVMVGMYDRAGLLSFGMVFVMCMMHKPDVRALWGLVLLGVLSMGFLWATDVHIPLPGREREISFDQLVTNVASVLGTTKTGDLDETKEWRLQWWNDIVGYTVRGRHFWTGKGFGVNLTEDDGFLGHEEDATALRSPHNGHVTVLARAGVPGLILWVLLHGSWVAGLAVCYCRSWWREERRWHGLFFVLFAYWAAFMFNASFDVVLEGPMAGIWFWAVFGVGLAAMWLYWRDPAVLGEVIVDGAGGEVRATRVEQWQWETGGMKPVAYITTSWDDGHPLDLRVAELLAKYGLTGTFYVPRSTEWGTMTPAQLRELSSTFEIGGHTLEHPPLTKAAPDQARQEIIGCKQWIEDVTGQTCSLFCPPGGKFTAEHANVVRQAGFVGMRSVELLSLDFPRRMSVAGGDGLSLLPTSVQAYPHDFRAYAKNLVRRGAIRNVRQLFLYRRKGNWPGLTQRLLARVVERGGVLHLWGHSWELESLGQWQRLEEVLRMLGEHADRAPAVTNLQLCQAVAPTEVVPT